MKRKQIDVEEPERPKCGKCGKDAHYDFRLTVQELTLQPEGSVRQRWMPDYQRSAFSVNMSLCPGCFQASICVGLSVDVDATAASSSESKS